MVKANDDFKDRIQLRIDHNLNQEATWVFEQLGMSSSTAIRLFYQQVVLHRGLPFELRLNDVDHHLSGGDKQ